MNPRESVEMVKEQLRIQAKELKKRDAEKTKHDAKIKHVLKLSQEKIQVLKNTVAEKEEEIQKVHVSGPKLAFDKKSDSDKDDDGGSSEKDQQLIKELKENLDKEKKDKEKLEEALKKTAEAQPSTPAPEQAPEIKKVIKKVKDPKLIKALKKLKLKNQELEERMEKQTSITSQNDKEKELLTHELKRLRRQPDASKEIKKKIKAQEKRHKKGIEAYEKIIKEKTELINSYEKVMYDNQDEDGKTRLPSEIVKELKDNIAGLEKEKDETEKKLIEEKKKFQKKLAEEIEKLEEEWADKLKKLAQRNKGAQQPEEEEGAPLWMVTYSDMVTLIMTFFILYYSIASMNMQKFKEAIIGEEQASIGLLELLDSAEIKESIQELTQQKSNDILSEMSEVAEDSEMDVETSSAKVVVRVPGANLFKPGKADLELTARPVLDEVIRVINKHPNYKIHIQGHTDDESISTERFPTNWELSAARATAVLRYFIDKGAEPKRMTATGYADTFPLARNDTAPGRAKNRRVEFVLEKEK